MKVSKVTNRNIQMMKVDNDYTEDDMKNEYDYYMASKLSKLLLEKGLINQEEYKKIHENNIKRYKPFLADLMS